MKEGERDSATQEAILWWPKFDNFYQQKTELFKLQAKCCVQFDIQSMHHEIVANNIHKRVMCQSSHINWKEEYSIVFNNCQICCFYFWVCYLQEMNYLLLACHPNPQCMFVVTKKEVICCRLAH